MGKTTKLKHREKWSKNGGEDGTPCHKVQRSQISIFFLQAILMKINSQKYNKKLKSIFPRDIKNHNY